MKRKRLRVLRRCAWWAGGICVAISTKSKPVYCPEERATVEGMDPGVCCHSPLLGKGAGWMIGWEVQVK